MGKRVQYHFQLNIILSDNVYTVIHSIYKSVAINSNYTYIHMTRNKEFIRLRIKIGEIKYWIIEQGT